MSKTIWDRFAPIYSLAMKSQIKRTVLAVIIFCSLSFSYAKENSTNDLSFGTFALIQSRKSGGGINFSFPIYSSQTGFFIRDEISASLYLANDSGIRRSRRF